MKKSLILALAFALILALPGCAGKSMDEDTEHKLIYGSTLDDDADNSQYAVSLPEDVAAPLSPAPEHDWGITLSVADLSPSRLTLVISQAGGEATGELTFGSDHALEVLRDGAWEAVPFATEMEVCWTAEAYLVPMEGSTEVEITFEHLYGALPPGHYRLSKQFMDFRATGDYDTQSLYIEFDI